MIAFESTKQLEDHRVIGSRAIIGRAEGIIMERHGVGVGEAYSRLRGTAERTDRSLVDVAVAVVRTCRPESAVERGPASQPAA